MALNRRSPLKRKKAVRKKSAKMPAKSKLDDLFRQFIRQRDGMMCQVARHWWVDEDGHPHTCSGPIQVSHIYSRRYLSTRWMPENAVLKCAAHHYWWSDRPLDGAHWFDSTYPGRREIIRERLALNQRPDFRDVEAELRGLLTGVASLA